MFRCYSPAMKSGKNKNNQQSITQPLIQDLKDRERLNSTKQNPTIGSQPLQPADLYQDAGGGYNTDFTFIQD